MANGNVCSVCIASIQTSIEVTRDHPNTHWANKLDVSEASVRRHFKHVDRGEPYRLGEDLVGYKTNRSKLPAESEGNQTVEESSDGRKSYEAVEDRNITLEDVREWIKSSGDDPEDYFYSVRSIKYGDKFSNKMSAWPKPIKRGILEEYDVVEDIDPIAILSDLRSQFPLMPEETEEGESAFVLSLNDTQLGKDEGGGTVETLRRVARLTLDARQRIETLRSIGHDLGTLVIIGGGDIVEGCSIYPNQSYNLDLSRRGQINAGVTMILDVIDTLAPSFERVIVLAARGNHGENRINGHRTTLYDNDDTLVFEMARQATSRDPYLDHVEYIIAQDEAGVTAEVAGWVLGTTHGDVYGKGVPGATQEMKAKNWYKNMAMKRDPIGSADVLITHHYHHDKMADWGACWWRQTPALDGGSLWFEQTTGEYSQAGMLTFVMTPTERYVDEAVLR